jgi:PAS domain-containing protein
MFMASPLPASLSRESDGRLLAVNDAWLAVTGRTREQVLGRSTLELGHWRTPQDRQRYLDAVRHGDSHHSLCLEEGLPYRVRLHTSRIGHADDPLLLVFMTEISREVQAEQAFQKASLELQQQVELHAAIEKLTRAGHWTTAAAEQDVIWSAGLFELAGLDPRPSIRRQEGRGGIHPDDRPAWLAAREAMDGRTVDFRWLRPDGRQVWLRTRMARTEVAGNPQTDFGVVHDVTAEREAGQALARQLQVLQRITASVPGIVYQARLHADGRSSFPFVSEAVRQMLELDPDELRTDGRALFSRIHPDDRAEVLEALAKSARQLSALRMVYRAVLPQRGERWYSVEAIPEREPDGTVLWHGFTSDVTEQRTVEQAMERQHRLLEAVRLAQAVYIEADDKRRAFEGLLAALLSVTGSEYGFVGEVLYDLRDSPYLKVHAITDIAWDEA